RSSRLLRLLRLLWLLLGWLGLRSGLLLLERWFWSRLRFTTGAIGVAHAHFGTLVDLTGRIPRQAGAGTPFGAALNTIYRNAEFFELVSDLINIPTHVVIRVD